MKPKEKAQELFEEMLLVYELDGRYLISRHSAKQCAIIAVDQIIDCTRNGFGTTKFSKQYWQQVKEEINNLLN